MTSILGRQVYVPSAWCSYSRLSPPLMFRKKNKKNHQRQNTKPMSKPTSLMLYFVHPLIDICTEIVLIRLLVRRPKALISPSRSGEAIEMMRSLYGAIGRNTLHLMAKGTSTAYQPLIRGFSWPDWNTHYKHMISPQPASVLKTLN